MVRIGRYPLHHGTVGAIRSLGRAGVPVYAVVEDRLTPAAVSRYLAGRFVWPTSGTESREYLVEQVASFVTRIGRPTVVVATDDEAATLVAEAGSDLGQVLAPGVDADLPRQLASKRSLHTLCASLGVTTPMASFSASLADVAAYARDGLFPVVVKNSDSWLRLGAPAVAGSTIVASGEELLRLARTWPDPPHVMLQEYIPPEASEDWIVQAYSAQDGTIAPLFTGVKLRSWPVQGGITVEGRAIANPRLAQMSERIFDELGYRGVSDLDWRFDRRDGVYKLLDFNPRVGAQFRLFETDAGIDVVRALHLDLTGRPVPEGTPVEGRRFVCEQLYLPGRLSRARSASTPGATTEGADGPLELAWLALDDPLPVAAMLARFAGPALRRLASLLVRSRKGSEAAGGRRGVRQASRPIVTRRAVKPVPQTNRSTGPNDGAAARPVKNSPGTDDSKRPERRGADPTRSM